MVSTDGVAETALASRYISQLCKHWGHKFAVRFDAMSGEIDLPLGRCRLQARPDRLDIRLEAAERDTLGRLEQVVESHLERFAFREPFHVSWSQAD